MLRITDVAKNLLIINVMFFLAGFIFGEQQMQNLMALHYPESPLFRPLQIATHFFMHGGVFHIFFNMFALVMFGSALETRWGPKRFLLFYFICAFGAAALHMGFSWWEYQTYDAQIAEVLKSFNADPTADYLKAQFGQIANSDFASRSAEQANYVEAYRAAIRALQEGSVGAVQQGQWVIENFPAYTYKSVAIVGASGAIYGLLLGFGMLFPNVELMLIFLPIPIKAKYFIPVLMLVELYLGFNQFSWDNIAHFAHLGGALTGFLLILYWRQTGQGV